MGRLSPYKMIFITPGKNMSSKKKNLGARRMGREWTLQFLYQLDVSKEEFSESVLNIFWQQLELSPSLPKEDKYLKGRDFAQKLITGVLQSKESLDEKISSFSDNWLIDRMANVDRNILRMTAYELAFEDTPANIAINEAIEISKTFGDKESSRFINAILDRFNKSLISEKAEEN